MLPLTAVPATFRRMVRALAATALVGGVTAFAAIDPTDRSEPSLLAARTLLLDITRAGERLVAVGDRGHIVISLDDGETWTQAVTPTRAMLTGVSFGSDTHGWAVGHDGVILATPDAGRTWTRQDGGNDLETVFLDVLALDAQRAFAIGAYGKFLATADGGRTWTERKIHDEDLHFNRLTRDQEGTLFIAGEAGLVLISRDHGATWTRSALDYEGSLYGVRPLSGGVLLAYGLRGRVFLSTDNGETWEQRESEATVIMMSAARLRDGVAVLAGQGGNFVITRDGGRSFHHWKPDDFGTSVADLAVARNGTLITVGEAGAVRVQIP
jgi:photosystem II stability/assembly factor-like uncharacterized protein